MLDLEGGLRVGRGVGSPRLSSEDDISVVGVCARWCGNGDGVGGGE